MSFRTIQTQKSYVDSRGAVDTSTVVLSSATLNSTYPNAKTGFKVYALSITAGKMIYEKTPTANQWAQYPVTVTP